MKRTTGILVCTLAAGMAWAQNPQVLQNVRTQMNTVQQSNTAASNQALGIKSTPAKESAKPTTTAAKSNTAAKSSAPAKANVAQAKANAVQAKANVAQANANVAQAKANVVPAKANVKSAQPKIVSASHGAKSAEPFTEKKPAHASSSPKIGLKQIHATSQAKPAAAQKKAVAAAKSPAAASSGSSDAAGAISSEEGKGDEDGVKDAQEKKWSMSGKRDPFISPVVSHAGGSGCSTGKKCLEIGAINLRGVVHSDGGFIAVVTNNLNKAYFLRENDPVFDGYVVKITGDSIVFKATMQDRLGKTFTREVTKKITTPAV